MHENNIHKVEDRIASIAQPWVKPIVRGKAATKVEFSAGKGCCGLGRLTGRPKIPAKNRFTWKYS